MRASRLLQILLLAGERELGRDLVRAQIQVPVGVQLVHRPQQAGQHRFDRRPLPRHALSGRGAGAGRRGRGGGGGKGTEGKK